MQSDNAVVWQLRILAEADPGALVRVLQLFQARNLVPRRITAARVDIEFLEIWIDIDPADCAQEAFRLVVAKIGELPIVITAAVVTPSP